MRQRFDRAKGMTFIEVMIALVIIFSVIFVVIRLFVAGTYGLRLTKFKTMAIFLAQKKMEEVIYQPSSLMSNETGHFDNEFSLFSYQVALSDYPGTKLKEVIVNVKDPQGKTFELRCLKESSQGQLTFWSNRDGKPAIYLMYADGGGCRRLTDEGSINKDPALSPDGTRLAFVSNREEGAHHLYLMDIRRKRVKRFTRTFINPSTPAWSPDGRKIAFAGYDKGYSQIYVVDITGEGLVNITQSFFHENNPYWSPDGSHIAFVSNRDGSPNIYTMSALGGNARQLTSTQAWNASPCWSPDGRSILFVSNRESTTDIYVMNADGSSQKRLTKSLAMVCDPVWSPDGQDIAFCSTTDNPAPEIYIINKEGGNVRRINRNEAVDRCVRWGN